MIELLAMMYVNWKLGSSHALSKQTMIGTTFTQNGKSGHQQSTSEVQPHALVRPQHFTWCGKLQQAKFGLQVVNIKYNTQDEE